MTTDISPEAVERIKAEVMTLDYQGSLWVPAEDYATLSARVSELEVERDALKEEYHAFEREVEQREEEFARKMGVLEARAEAAEARVAELGREVNRAKYGDPDFSWSIHKAAMDDLEAENEKLREQVKQEKEENRWAYIDAALASLTHGNK